MLRACLAFVAVILAQAQDAATGCAVTQPPAVPFVPPAPYPASLAGSFYIGTPDLWTLHGDERWVGLITPAGIRVKVPWFVADGAALPRPDITIRGRRLDGSSDVLKVEGVNTGKLKEYVFFPSGLLFPSAGCWEITATRPGVELKFVARVSGIRRE